jgi:hypothetical protein
VDSFHPPHSAVVRRDTSYPTRATIKSVREEPRWFESRLTSLSTGSCRRRPGSEGFPADSSEPTPSPRPWASARARHFADNSTVIAASELHAVKRTFYKAEKRPFLLGVDTGNLDMGNLDQGPWTRPITRAASSLPLRRVRGSSSKSRTPSDANSAKRCDRRRA